MRPSSDYDARKLASLLRHEILEGKYAADELFPSIRTLAEQHKMGLRAVCAATEMLVAERLLYRRARSGTFVRRLPPAEPDTTCRQPLQCVTILEHPRGTLPSFVRVNYLEGYTQAMDKFQARMRIMGLPAELEQIESVLSDQYPLQEQGVILVNIIEEKVLQWFNERRIRFVVQNYTQYSKEFLPPHHSVVVNKIGGAFAATQHLLRRGYRRIGYAGQLPGDPQNSTEVYDGYMAAMRAAGLEPRTADILPFKTDDPTSACSLALPLMQERKLPEAYLAQTDSGAIGIVQAAQKMGLRVPDDLSVVGFNDQAEAEACEPPLTSVAIPRTRLGYTAVELLMAPPAGPDAEPVAEVLECQLIERRSVAFRSSRKP